MSTQYGYDSFARANQSGTFGTATDGQTYTQSRGNQTLSISSNEGVMTYNGSLTTGVVTMGSTKVGDGIYAVRCTQTSTSDIMGIAPRFKDSNNFYSFVQGATAGQFQLRLDNAGTFSTVAGVAFTTTAGTYYWIKCAIIGTSFFGKIWQDGTAEPNTWQIGALGTTDSTIAGPQSFGLVGTPNTTSNTVKFDSFYVIDYTNSDSIPVADLGGSLELWAVESLSVADAGGSLQEWGQDGLTGSDLGGSLQEWGIESLTTTDTGGSLQAWGQDGLTGGDAPSSFIDTTQLVDGNTTTDQGNLTMWPLDSLTVVDTPAYTDSAIPADSLVAVSAPNLTDTFGASDALTAVDTGTVSDGASLSDAGSASDTGTLLTWTGDTLTISDVIAAQDLALLADLGTASDTILQTDMPLATDNLPVSDAVQVGDSTLPIDAPTLSDSGTLSLWPVDLLTALDQGFYTDGAVLLDALASADSGGLSQGTTNNAMSGEDDLMVSDIGSLLAWTLDAQSVSDTLSIAGTALLMDTGLVTDTSLQTDTPLGTDALAGSDSMQAVDSTLPLDALSASDKSASSLTPLFVDTGSVSDTALPVASTTFVDAPTCSDALQVTGSAMLADALTPSDSGLSSGMPIPVDSLILADQMSISITLILIESGNTSDQGNTQQWGIDATDVASDGGGLLTWPIDRLFANDSTLFIEGVTLAEQSMVSDAGSGLALSPVATIYVAFNVNLPGTTFNVSLPNTTFTVSLPGTTFNPTIP